jgi:hypothetical protein
MVQNGLVAALFKDHPVQPVHKVLLVTKVHKDQTGQWVQPVHKALPVHRDHKALLAHRDHKGHRAVLERKDRLAHKDQQGQSQRHLLMASFIQDVALMRHGK